MAWGGAYALPRVFFFHRSDTPSAGSVAGFVKSLRKGEALDRIRQQRRPHLRPGPITLSHDAPRIP